MCWKRFTLFYFIKNHISIWESNKLPYWNSYILRFWTQPKIFLNPFKDYKWFSDYSANIKMKSWNSLCYWITKYLSHCWKFEMSTRFIWRDYIKHLYRIMVICQKFHLNKSLQIRTEVYFIRINLNSAVFNVSEILKCFLENPSLCSQIN